MNTSPLDPAVIEKIAEDMDIPLSFVEKDWFVIETIRLIKSMDNDNCTFLFSGGTSLSKAHKIMKRFSEDIDFRVLAKTMPNRKARRELRDKMEKILTTSPYFKIIEHQSYDESTLFQLHLSYSSLFAKNDALRPHIKL